MSQSLQCPRCNGAVSVDEHAAGKRVKCPHCDETFVAPGITAQESDDDDWLTLDEVPLASTSGDKQGLELSNPPVEEIPVEEIPVEEIPVEEIPVEEISEEAISLEDASLDDLTVQPELNRAETGPKSSVDASAGSKFSSDEEALLAEFTSDLDEFTAQIESPPSPHPSAGSLSAKASGGGSSASSPAAGEPVADAVEYETEYRVKCNICGTVLYAKAHQAGKTLKCSDCFSPVTVPPPPKVAKGSAVNVEDAETFQFEDRPHVQRGPDPYKQSAEELLEEASQEEETETKTVYEDVPSVKDWVLNVFGIYKDLGVVVHWLGLVVLAAVPTALALSMGNPILILGLFPFGFFIGVLTVSCGFAIMHAVANQEETVEEWPTLDPMAWLGQLFVAVAAAAVAVIPVWMVCLMILGPSLISVAITMLSVYFVFPFVLLSMLDMNSALVPFSPEVARSVTKCEEAWGGFYFSSGILFIGLFLVFTIAGTMSPVSQATFDIAAAIGVTLAYFGMIGRLAFAIGQTINAPPRHDEDLDRTRHTDVV